MWKEYTREKPARRGWTLAMMGLAFVGTIGLAKILTDERAPAVLDLTQRQSLPRWPLSFKLPDDFRWTPVRGAIRAPPQLGNLAGMGIAAFRGWNETGAHTEVLFRFRLVQDSISPELTAERVFLIPVDEGVDIEIDSTPGIMSISLGKDGSTRFSAVACSERGVAVLVVFHADPRVDGKTEVFEAICNSIAFQDP